MNKRALSDTFNPFKRYYDIEKHINPGVGAFVGGAIGGGIGYYGSKHLVNLAIRLMFANLPKDKRAEIVSQVQNNPRLARIGGTIGAIGGMYFGGARDFDTSNWKGFVRSLYDKDYWKTKKPLEQRLADFRKKIQSGWYTSKQGSVVGGYNSSIIPISQSLDLIDDDRFLNPYQKNVTADLIFGAENKDSGLTSGKNLTRSAIKAGIGFAPAYAFGKGVGSILGLPPPVRDRFSMVGGLAAAVANSGVLNQFKR
jgi:hypothetical protein